MTNKSKSDIFGSVNLYDFTSLTSFMIDKTLVDKIQNLCEAKLECLASDSYIVNLSTEDVIGLFGKFGEILRSDPSNGVVFISGKDFFLQIGISHLVKYKEIVYRLRAKSTNIEAIKKQIDDVLKPYIVQDASWTKVDVDWYFADKESGVDCRRVTELFDDIIHPEAYPGLDLEIFVQRYLDSSSSVLILTGEPGTGKTRLIRYIVQQIGKRKEKNIKAAVEHFTNYDFEEMESKKPVPKLIYTTDERAMKDESLYIQLRCQDYDLMVLEDVDSFLVERKDGNEVMHRFLASSDGLLPNRRKIIFTTNLNMQEVDRALMRPGRCFASMHLKALGIEESKKLLAKLSDKDFNITKSHTLAELYNLVYQHSYEQEPVKKVGFR